MPTKNDEKLWESAKRHAQAKGKGNNFAHVTSLYMKMKSEAQADVERMECEVQVTRLDEEKRQAFGWAYVTRDKEGNLVQDLKKATCDTPVLEEAVYEFVLTCRSYGDMHERDGENNFIQRGRLIESIMFTREKMAALGIPAGTIPEGWWVGFHIDDDEAWELMKRGDRPAFSIAAEAICKYE